MFITVTTKSHQNLYNSVCTITDFSKSASSSSSSSMNLKFNVFGYSGHKSGGC